MATNSMENWSPPQSTSGASHAEPGSSANRRSTSNVITMKRVKKGASQDRFEYAVPLSHHWGIFLSIVQSHDGKCYVTFALRKFYLNKYNEMRPSVPKRKDLGNGNVKKEPNGLSLSYEELQNLADAAREVNLVLVGRSSSAQVLTVTNERELADFIQFVRDFMYHGKNASFDGKLRLILDRNKF